MSEPSVQDQRYATLAAIAGSQYFALDDLEWTYGNTPPTPPTEIPVNSALPQIVGIAEVGQTLYATNGSWTNTPTTFTFQWRRGASNISGATSSSYVLQAADAGATITVRVIATNIIGPSASATSAGVSIPVAPPVNTAVPTITGTVAVGEVLTGSNGTWTGTGITYTYSWWRNGSTQIPGATANTYTIVSGDVGNTLQFRVTATNSGGAVTASSTQTIAVPAPPDPGVLRTYTNTVANGIVGGDTPDVPREWAASVPVNSWTDVGPQTFSAWAVTGIPYAASDYNGGNPKDSIVTAYCGPAIDKDSQHFYGGGHGDGSCNAVVRMRKDTLAFELAGQPTDPSKYPPSYYKGGAAQPGPLVYPSGAGSLILLPVPSSSGNFLTSAELTDPADAPYATAFARSSSHMYAAACKRGSVIHYFYLKYGEFDTATGLWNKDVKDLEIGDQLYAYFSSFGRVPLQQGTVATYDEVTDKIYVTLNPGDSGGGWRNRIMEWDPVTRTIVNVYTPGDMGVIGNSVSVIRVNRKLYLFLKTAEAPLTAMNSGIIFDMDTKVVQKFIVDGNPDRTKYVEGTSQETIPGWYDGLKIRRWNYNTTNRGFIASLNLIPTGGAGTNASPFILTQTDTAIANSGGGSYIYRLDYDEASGCVLLVPNATSRARALRFVE